MNKIWLVSAALVAVLAGGSAFAADLPAAPQVYAPRPALVPPIYSWTGCYLGIEGGGTWGRSQQIAGTSPVPANVGLPITDPFNVNGALFGGTVGCNYQFGSVVFGVENDFSWTNKSGSSPDIPPFAAGAVSSTKEDWLDTARGRVGFAWDRFMVYGTGGAAFADVGVNVCSVAAICVSDSQMRTGWTAGVGGEWAAWTSPGGSLTLKLEYLHADFGTGLFINPSVRIGAATFNSRNVSLTDDIVRGGVNWKFNGW
jgi:outer membrane immunogenic protein